MVLFKINVFSFSFSIVHGVEWSFFTLVFLLVDIKRLPVSWSTVELCAAECIKYVYIKGVDKVSETPGNIMQSDKIAPQ